MRTDFTLAPKSSLIEVTWNDADDSLWQASRLSPPHPRLSGRPCVNCSNLPNWFSIADDDKATLRLVSFNAAKKFKPLSATSAYLDSKDAGEFPPRSGKKAYDAWYEWCQIPVKDSQAFGSANVMVYQEDVDFLLKYAKSRASASK